MKVINLLNKIAKGEITELHKFKWNERVWEEYSKFEEINNDKSYQEHRENGVSFMRFENVCDARHLNDEVEIIEEDTFEDMREMDRVDGSDLVDLQSNSTLIEQNKAVTSLIMYLNMNVAKINQLIRNQKKIISKLEDNQ